jgi:hypothetical protein
VRSVWRKDCTFLWKKYTTSNLWQKVEHMIEVTLFLYVSLAIQESTQNEETVGIRTAGRGGSNLYS